MPTLPLPAAGLPNAHGCLEYAAEHGELLVLRGWMLDAAGPYDTVRALVGGAEVARAERIARPDLEAPMPHLPGVADAGFHVELPLALLDAEGRVELELVGERAGEPVARMQAGWLRHAEPPPLPPPHLMERVAHTRLDYLFRAGGTKTAFDFVRAARRARPGRAFERVLDWGCGCGRVTAHLAALLPGSAVVGVDVDREAVAWGARELTGASFVPGGTEPPLPFRTATFDLILAGSVFTHLTAALQDLWLAELRRLLVPGGLLVATTLGELAAELRASDAELAARLAEHGIDDSTHDAALDGVVEEGYYRATWQSRSWTAERWGRHLRVLAHEPAGFENYQDLWTLERPADG